MSGAALSVVSALAILFVFMRLGRRSRRLLRLPLAPALRWPVDFLIGAWLFALAALVAGLCGWFRPPTLVGLFGAGAAMGLAPWGRRRGGAVPYGDLLAAALPALILLPIALGPPFFYDALVYHLGLPWQALMEGRIAAHPEDLFSSFPPLAQLVYALPIAVGFDRVPALLHLASFVAAGLAVATLARRLGAKAGRARLAAGSLPLLPAVVLVPGLPAAEGWLLAGVVTALALLVGPETRRRGLSGAAFLVGLLSGIATAARLQGLPWAAIAFGFVALAALRRRDSPAGPGARRWARFWPLVWGVLGWGSGAAPWRLKNLILLGDPTAPLLWHREGIETLFRDSGSLMHLGGGVAGLLAAVGQALRPHVAYAGLLALAAALAVVGEASGPAAARTDGGNGLARRRRIGLAALLGLGAWAASGTLPRFLAPTLCLLLALTAAANGDRLRSIAGIACAAVTFALGLLFTLRDPVLHGSTRLMLAPSAAGEASFVINDPLPAFRAAGSLPADASVLFVAEARGYPFPRRAVVPSQHDLSPLRDLVESGPDARGVAARLRDRGITHVLVNRAEMRRLAGKYPVLPWRTDAGRERFQALLDLCGPPVVKEGETAIFALPPP